MEETLKLPIVNIGGKTYFVDKVEGQLRNIANPDDVIPFDEAFVRVRFTTEHVVLNDAEHIQRAKEELRHLIQDAHEGEDIESHLDTEPANPEVVKKILPELLKELEEHNDNA